MRRTRYPGLTIYLLLPTTAIVEFLPSPARGSCCSVPVVLMCYCCCRMVACRVMYLALVDAGLELLEEETGDTEETGDQTTVKEE